MKTRGFVSLIVITVTVGWLIGCGGSSRTENSSSMIQFTVLQSEGEFSAGGAVYNDANDNGIMDMSEAGIEGVTVSLTDMDDIVLDTTTTDADGNYSFAVTVGQFKVIETDLPGYLSTTPNEVSFEIIDQGVTINFGDIMEVSSYAVFGVVFDDMDGDGIMDAGEPGKEGVTVTLSGVGDVMTDADGGYAFAVTETGPYSVSVIEPDGYATTTPNPFDIVVTDADVQVDFGLVMVMDLVDVKPGSNVNPVNLRSRGVLPVAVLGSADLDVTSIDPATISLNGVAPLRWSIEDVCGPMPDPMDPPMDGDGEDDMEIPDGYDDLTLKFDTQEIAAAIEAMFGDVARGDIVTLSFTAENFDGVTLTGEEEVLIVQVR